MELYKEIPIEWDAPDLLKVLQDEYSIEFANLELSPVQVDSRPFSSKVPRSKNNYRHRLEVLGFVDKKHILDAGCGMGQWSYLMSQMNCQLTAIDQSKHRIEIAKYLNRNHHNISFLVGNLETIPFSATFDAIFCYSVFMFTRMQDVLSQFNKALKQDGIIYLNFNDVGYYMHRIMYYTHEVPNEEFVKQFVTMIQNYYQKNFVSSLMTMEVFEHLAKENGFYIEYVGFEGESAKMPFYITNFFGFPYINEVLLRKIY